MAVDVSAIDPLLDRLNKLFAGTGLVREKMEVWTLLRDIAREHALGNLTDVETKMYVSEAVKRLASVLAAAGKPVSAEQLAEQLYADVLALSTRTVSALRTEVMHKVRSRRERARIRSEFESLL